MNKEEFYLVYENELSHNHVVRYKGQYYKLNSRISKQDITVLVNPSNITQLEQCERSKHIRIVGVVIFHGTEGIYTDV